MMVPDGVEHISGPNKEPRLFLGFSTTSFSLPLGSISLCTFSRPRTSPSSSSLLLFFGSDGMRDEEEATSPRRAGSMLLIFWKLADSMVTAGVGMVGGAVWPYPHCWSFCAIELVQVAFCLGCCLRCD